jgi:asparagine synthase (glutamine-hydrolysing)
MLQERDQLAASLQLPRATSSLEVVAAAIGRSSAPSSLQLYGEYAVAAWDEHAQQLRCARDGFGVRVAFVGWSQSTIVVSNVVEAVLAHPEISRALDQDSLVRFLATASLTNSIRTAYRDVRLLPPGHTLVVGREGSASLIRHFQLPAPRPSNADARDVLAGYRDVLHRAVGDRIGGQHTTLFLSGGVDSTTIAAVARDNEPPPRAITIEYAMGDARTEVELATATARQLRLSHEIVPGDSFGALHADAGGNVPALPIDEPTLSDWRAVLRHAARHSSLAIYGEDGDALFAPSGGTALFSEQGAGSVMLETARYAARAGRLPYLGIRLRERLHGGPKTPSPPPWLTASAITKASAEEDSRLLGQAPQPLAVGSALGKFVARVDAALPRDFALTISPEFTCAPVAVTLPLLDTRVVQYVLSLPSIPWRQHKLLARRAFKGYLPDAVLRRPKTPVVGFFADLVERSRTGGEVETLRQWLPEEVAAWLNLDVWREALMHGEPAEVMAAWRPLMLGAWLQRQRQ